MSIDAICGSKASLVDVARECISPVRVYQDKPLCAASSFCEYLTCRLRSFGGGTISLDPEKLFSCLYPDWDSAFGPSGQVLAYFELWKSVHEGRSEHKALGSGMISAMKRLRPLSLETVHASCDDAFLSRIRSEIRNGTPVLVDFPLALSCPGSFRSGVFLPLQDGERLMLGRHVVLACACDVGAFRSGRFCAGGVVIKNCWGTSWGVGGFGGLHEGLYLSEARTRAYVMRSELSGEGRWRKDSGDM